ncbi:hypothetical protein KUCAC02_023732 [Chaenocephalus aceratus]|uniref:Uncharacterized protein n=1 Tax=Chaenocephalus aceratus TaxID=36190 RepID=A0ACB9WFQ8_CHAAC|nr:hypothetical protein KUCAC02_023732 [Chaenocephalus aceratus]
MEVEEPEMAEEVSEHEVSSEEFEFIERPPRGVIDEFLEALDTSKFASSKPPEIPMDDDLSFGHRDVAPAPLRSKRRLQARAPTASSPRTPPRRARPSWRSLTFSSHHPKLRSPTPLFANQKRQSLRRACLRCQA